MNRVAAGVAALISGAFSNATDILRTFKVRVLVDEAVSLRLEQARLAASLLSRTFTSVMVAGVSQSNRPFVTAFAPDVRFDDVGSTDPSPVDITVCFSDAPVSERHIYASYRGWSAVLSTEGTPARAGENILAALYSAVLACQHSFNVAFADSIDGISPMSGCESWNLASGGRGEYPESVAARGCVGPQLDFTIVGLGSVGLALIYALSRVPGVTGRIALIDHEMIDEGNCDRYAVVTRQNINQFKTHWARTLLAQAHPRLQLVLSSRSGISAGVEPRVVPSLSAVTTPVLLQMVPFVTFLEPDYLSTREPISTAPQRLIIAAVDSAVTRRDIQFGLHHEVLNVWTDSMEGVSSWGFSFHRIGSGACMACSYHRPTDDPGGLIDFQARQLGWSVAKTKSYLEDPEKVLSEDDLADLQRRRGYDATYLSGFLGKPVRAILTGVCGHGAAVGNDRVAAPPVPHVPALVGIHAAAAIVLRALGAAHPERVQGDSLRSQSTAFTVPVGSPVAGCLCQNPRIKNWYSKYWELNGEASSP